MSHSVFSTEKISVRNPYGKKIASSWETALSRLNFSRNITFRQPHTKRYNQLMQTTKYLPTSYHCYKTLNLSGSRTVLWLNLVAVLLLFFFGWLFSRLITKFTPINPFKSGILGFFSSFSLLSIGVFLLSILIMLIFHELTHGLFFWLFTQERPTFSLKAGYAFAAAPQWYFSRLQYLIVGLSPFVIITISSMLLIQLVPIFIIKYLLIIATFNAAGSIGDLIVVGWILKQPMNILVKDEGDKFSTYLSIAPSTPYEQ
jgi:hypothetical protein